MPAGVPPCDRCPTPSVTWLRYCGLHLCGPHLVDFVERRVRKEVRRQGGLPKGLRVAVACSGGKDSVVALEMMADLAADRADVELVAVTVDEGIAGYRAAGLAVAAGHARRLGVEHVVVATRDLAGVSIDAVHAAGPERAPCSYCGVFRRRLLNDAARDVGADLVVTGHNLDDMAQSVLMNLAGGDLARLARLGPHTTRKEGLVPRRMPLRTIPETEVYLTAMVRRLAFHDGECPYAAQGQRSLWRDLVARMEDAKPGTRHALLRTADALAPVLAAATPTLPLGTCSECGEPASGATCQVCALGAEVRTLTPGQRPS